MTGMEHAIEQAARALYAHRQVVGDFPDGTTDWDDLPEPWREEWREAGEYVVRVLADAGLIAPAPLREEWAAIDDDGDVRMRYGADSHSPHREFGTSWTYSRWVSDWKPYAAEGDGRAEQ